MSKLTLISQTPKVVDMDMALPVTEEMIILMELSGYYLVSQEFLALKYKRDDDREIVFFHNRIGIKKKESFTIVFTTQDMNWVDLMDILFFNGGLTQDMLPELANYLAYVHNNNGVETNISLTTYSRNVFFGMGCFPMQGEGYGNQTRA